MLKKFKNSILFNYKGESLRIYSPSKGVIRVQGNYQKDISKNNFNLLKIDPIDVEIFAYEKGLVLKSSDLKVMVSKMGELSFYENDKLILKEKYRSFDYDLPHSLPLKEVAREYKVTSKPFALKVSFEGNDEEKIYGMGIYQMPYLNLKGTRVDLCQKNTQVSIPFYLSNLHYGFMWNNPSLGEASFLKNGTEFISFASTSLDYLVIGGETYKEIIKRYTSLIGRAPMIDTSLLGLWQSKLRYRTPEEVINVIDEYEKRDIHLSLIVIDYFHWTRQGEWEFDRKYWKNIDKLIEKACKSQVKFMVSIWPTVDKKSKYFKKMDEEGLLIKPIRGTQAYDFQGDCLIVDFTNPKSQKFVNKLVKRNYLDKGINYLRLDQAEPEFTSYDLDNYLYYIASSSEVTNSYPYHYLKAFAKENDNKIYLIRSAWFGSQKLGALLWSGDVQGTFESMKDQLVSSLNAGISGMNWYTNDIGGFSGNVEDPKWRELLVRWFEWMVFSPILRMHGDRLPWNIKNLDNRDYGGGFTHTGQANEIYSFGEDIYRILLKNLRLREKLKPYIETLFKESSENGSPIMRTLFYEFEDDINAYKYEDEYMFGDKYLVAPILEYKARKRNVYLPKGKWKNIFNDEIVNGGIEIEVDAPIEYIPVFERIE